ncbi:MAG: PASTA domain-containing protein [candidate division WOR-3 bacterium]|jgi:serine/threonine-protein kinase|nr:PASTA domain-containing protein [Bacillota bacterium]MCR4423558.1 PASTA domain-containing protein [candidate division WOR-3 bacterium]MDH7518897.1 PASTA domain-containing protein [bacterium]
MARAQTLADLLAERRVVPSPELENIFVSILDDLAHAHSQGRLHGDIKPKKIVQVEDGVWRLIDYGVSRVGTARYIAPEKAQRKSVDARADLYSLGVVLYEAATGKPPFEAELGADLIRAHIEQPPPAPRSIRPEITPELEKVILKALAKKPEERFQTAKDFRAALLAVIPKELEKKPAPITSEQPRPEPIKMTQPPRQTESTPAAAVSKSVMSTARPVSPPKAAPPVAAVPLPRERGRGPLVWIVLAGLILVAVGSWLIIGGQGKPIPDVQGVYQAEAQKKLEDAGFRVELAEDKDDTFALGKVAEQIPSAGTKMKKGGVVKLRLSTGLVSIPDVTGVAEAVARNQLLKIGLDSVVVVREYSDQYRTGVVIGIEPRAGAKLKPHTGVKLKVAAGRATCPACGAKREPGAQFCTRCGYRFED